MKEKKTTSEPTHARAIILNRPGVLRCGRFEANTPYTVGEGKDVSAEEATRLIEAKGFTALSDADARRIETTAAPADETNNA